MPRHCRDDDKVAERKRGQGRLWLNGSHERNTRSSAFHPGMERGELDWRGGKGKFLEQRSEGTRFRSNFKGKRKKGGSIFGMEMLDYGR